MEKIINTRITERIKVRSHRKTGMIIPMIFLFVFMTVMVIYTSMLMYNVAVSNSNAVMEDRIIFLSLKRPYQARTSEKKYLSMSLEEHRLQML